MTSHETILAELQKEGNPSKAGIMRSFFQTGPGGYAEGDRFLGVTVPKIRQFVTTNKTLDHASIQKLLESSYNEARLLGLLILVKQFQSSNDIEKKSIHDFYHSNLVYINNWNLVDASAHHIVGAYIYEIEKSNNILKLLVSDQNLWKRRVAIVSTWYHIKKKSFETPIDIISMCLRDNHHLIHKASGWMLREVGKQNLKILLRFLDQYASMMPRVMLRYSIEKLDNDQRKKYMLLKPN